MAKNKKKTSHVFPYECTCRPIALSEQKVEGRKRDIARTAIRSVECQVHPAHRYMPRFVNYAHS